MSLLLLLLAVVAGAIAALDDEPAGWAAAAICVAGAVACAAIDAYDRADHERHQR